MRAGRLRGISGEGCLLDSGGTGGREAYKHTTVEPIGLLWAQGGVTAHQLPRARIDLASVALTVFIV